MICTALLTAALLSVGSVDDSVTVGETYPFTSPKYILDTPQGKKSAFNEFKATVTIRTSETVYEPIESAVATMRPEKPAKPFSLLPVLHQGKGGDSEWDPSLDGAALGFNFQSNSFGSQVTRYFESARDTILKKYNNAAIRIDPNVGIRSGGWTKRAYGHKPWHEIIEINVHSRTVVEGDPVPEFKPQNIPSTVAVYEWHLPMPKPIREEFYPDKDKFQEVPEGVPFASIPDVGQWGNPGNIVTVPLPQPGNGGTAPGNYDDLIGGSLPMPIKINFPPGSGESMNEISFPSGPLLDGWKVNLPPGTLWYPDKPGYQVVGSRLGFEYDFLAIVNRAPRPIRINCMNMNLKEPDGSVKYYPLANPDPVSMRIMSLPAISSRTPSPDQARTWIYTDRASLDEINKKLEPDVDSGHYLIALHQVFVAGGLSEADLAKKGVAEPFLLQEAAASQASVRWLMSHLERKRPKDVAAWLNGKPELLLLLFEQTNAAYGDRGQWVLNELLSSPNAEIRLAALRLIDGLGARALPHLENRLPNLSWTAMSGVKAEAELSWKVANKYSQKFSKFTLGLLASSQTSKQVADEAKSRLGS